MSPTPYSNLQRVDHMLRAFVRILKVTEGCDEEGFVASEDMCDIVERQISKIGEAAHAIDRAFQTQHPERSSTRCPSRSWAPPPHQPRPRKRDRQYVTRSKDVRRMEFPIL